MAFSKDTHQPLKDSPTPRVHAMRRVLMTGIIHEFTLIATGIAIIRFGG